MQRVVVGFGALHRVHGGVETLDQNLVSGGFGDGQVVDDFGSSARGFENDTFHLGADDRKVNRIGDLNSFIDYVDVVFLFVFRIDIDDLQESRRSLALAYNT